MHYGLAWGSPYGFEEDFFTICKFTDYLDGSGGKLTVRAASGYGDMYYGIVMAGKVLYVVYLPEGVTRVFSIVYDQGMLSQAIAAGADVDFPLSITPNSGWPDATIADLTIPQQDYLLDKARSIQINFDCVIEVLSAFGDSSQFSAWQIQGLQRYINGKPTGNKTQLSIDLILITASGPADGGFGDAVYGEMGYGGAGLGGTYRSLNLQLGTLVIAGGNVDGSGVVALAAKNGSGIVNAQVTLAYSADIPSLGTAFIAARWCQKYFLHAAQVLSFPRSPEGTVIDPGLANRLSGKVGPFLSAGTYNFLVQGETDTGTDGTNQAGQGSIAVPGRPKPPGVPVLNVAPGNFSNTKIDVKASATAGATYVFRDMQYLNGPVDFHLSAATYGAVTPSSTMTLTLPTLPGGAAAGIRRISLEAISGGVLDGHRQIFEIEYKSDGSIILPRPNVPQFSMKSKLNRQITVQFSYDRSNEAGVGATAQLFLVEKGGNVDFTTPAATLAIPAGGRIRTGTLSATAPANDWFQYCVRVATSGGVQSLNTAMQGPEWLSNVVPGIPANVSAALVG